MWVLRDFDAQDLFTVLDIANRVLDEAYSPELFLRIAELYPEGSIVAVEGARIIGFIIGVVSAPAEARVLVLAVEDADRGRGIGGALLAEFSSRFIAGGVERVRLEVRRSNDRAISFYERHGFRIARVLPQHYKDGEDAYVMTKPVK